MDALLGLDRDHQSSVSQRIPAEMINISRDLNRYMEWVAMNKEYLEALNSSKEFLAAAN